MCFHFPSPNCPSECNLSNQLKKGVALLTMPLNKPPIQLRPLNESLLVRTKILNYQVVLHHYIKNRIKRSMDEQAWAELSQAQQKLNLDKFGLKSKNWITQSKITHSNLISKLTPNIPQNIFNLNALVYNTQGNK